MNPPRPSVTTFARSLVAAELAADPGDVLGLGDRVVARLDGALGRLVGTAGLDALVSRAIVLARRSCPALAGVVAVPGGRIGGFRESLAGQDRAAIESAAETLVSHFVELLVVFIGEDVGMRLVGAALPGGSDAAPKKGES
jgi:hypothetical protein